MMNNIYHYMHIWLVEALSLILHKAIFPYNKAIYYIYYQVYAIIEKVPPTQSQNYQVTIIITQQFH